jgi:cell division protein FtsB
MIYSFSPPRPKRIISGEIRLALFFFMISIGMVVLAYGFLTYRTQQFDEQRKSFGKDIKQLEHSKREIEKRILLIESAVKKSEEISTNNMVMKESIHNLFDLVPDNITLNKADLDKKSLILYGVTPNKDAYEFMLQAPLKSIFHRTYTSFYPIENGWYNFVSTNYLEDESVTEVQE